MSKRKDRTRGENSPSPPEDSQRTKTSPPSLSSASERLAQAEADSSMTDSRTQRQTRRSRLSKDAVDAPGSSKPSYADAARGSPARSTGQPESSKSSSSRPTGHLEALKKPSPQPTSDEEAEDGFRFRWRSECYALALKGSRAHAVAAAEALNIPPHEYLKHTRRDWTTPPPEYSWTSNEKDKDTAVDSGVVKCDESKWAAIHASSTDEKGKGKVVDDGGVKYDEVKWTAVNDSSAGEKGKGKAIDDSSTGGKEKTKAVYGSVAYKEAKWPNINNDWEDEKEKEKTPDEEDLKVPRQREPQYRGKTPMEEEVVEGIEEVRRKQSAESGEMKEPPDPTNPETPPKHIPPPPPPDSMSRTYFPDIGTPPDDEDEMDGVDAHGYKYLEDSQESPTSRGPRSAADIIGPLSSKLAKLIDIRPYIPDIFSQYTSSPSEVYKPRRPEDQQKPFKPSPRNAFPLGCDGAGFQDVGGATVCPGDFVEDNQPWPKESPNQTPPKNQISNRHEPSSRTASRSHRRGNDSNTTEDGSESSTSTD